MYSVLIVDDEQPVREAVKLLCDWDTLNISEIYEACDGKSALEFVSKKHIDLVILDMNMPEMDGIEFLHQAQEKMFEIIVVSGYDKFDYAYEALKSKAVDYLLKPLIKSELNAALKKAVEKLNQAKIQKAGLLKLNHMLNITLPVLKEKICFAAIERMLSPTEKQVYANIINPNSIYKFFGVMVIKILSSCEDKAEKNFEQIEKVNKNFMESLDGNIMDGFYFKNPNQNDEYIVVLSLKSNVSTQAIKNLKKQFKQMSSRYANLTILVEIGCLQNDIMNLYLSYDFAKRRLKEINLLTLNNNQNKQTRHPNQIIANSFISSLPLIQNAIEKGSFPYLLDQLDEYLQQFIDTAYFSLEDADRLLSELDLMLRDIAIEHNLTQSELNELLKNIPICYSNFNDYKKLLHKLANTYFTAIRRQIKNRDSFEVCEIKKYIDSRYFEKISISFFSKKYYLSREYLMKLFKKEFGCGIYEYVLKVRMANAKKLIRDPNVKIQDIAQMVGYHDSNYFSKAFRNYYGMSPTSYQKYLCNLYSIDEL